MTFKGKCVRVSTHIVRGLRGDDDRIHHTEGGVVVLAWTDDVTCFGQYEMVIPAKAETLAKYRVGAEYTVTISESAE